MSFRRVINLTPIARTKLINMLRDSKVNNALFYVQGGGCNGLKYMIKPILDEPILDESILPISNEPKKDKIVTNNEIIPLSEKYPNLNLQVCNKSLIHLIGTEIDWNSDFMGQSFRFSNPNADGSCGCGATFSPKFD